VDIHAGDARRSQAVEDLGPHPFVVFTVGRDRGGVVSEVHGQDVAVHESAMREVLYFTGKVNGL
jgi:hypothetical protein